MQENRLVVAPGGCGEDAPEWLLGAIKKERMIQGFQDVLDKGKEEVGDAEVALYLYSANLAHPIRYELGQVYIYLASKLMKEYKPFGEPKLEPFMEKKLKEGLSHDEEREYLELKRDLWKARGGKIKSPLFEALASIKKKNSRMLNNG